MREVEVITAWGHQNISATNERTLEITKETHLTKRGDCIVAVAADKGLQDLSDSFKTLLTNDDAKLTVDIQAGGRFVTVEARGDSRLTLSHLTDLVVRKSSYVCPRTLAVRADVVAADFPRCHAARLRNPRQRVDIVLTVNVS
ncbi:MAG: DUF371 domain-containing protein [Candidatus Bathyarchaeota archaeon]|jgi:hypothetical protein|nr:DUF371 domain-containing protein [Candidatus Bathyarchaeota archaeon]